MHVETEGLGMRMLRIDGQISQSVLICIDLHGSTTKLSFMQAMSKVIQHHILT